MNQSQALYDTSPALALIDPWLRSHLPQLPQAVVRHFVHLVTAVFEQRSLLLETIAESSVFTANANSNVTQVRRIIQDERLTLEAIYYPFVRSILAQIPTDVLYLTMDETSHHTDYNLIQVGWATDGVSIPLGFWVYAPNEPWADDARVLLHQLDTLLPDGVAVVLLADRVHTGEPLLDCLDKLGWYYVFRAAETTYIEHPRLGWKELRKVYKQANRPRFLANVRLWKGGNRRTNVSIHKHVRRGFRPTIWYLVSDLPATQARLVEYACRWWQECTFKTLKSGMFEWERGRVTQPKRVYVLLMAVGCAMWALWLIGRSDSKPTAATGRPGRAPRQNILRRGAALFRVAVKQRTSLSLSLPPAPRVYTHPRRREKVV